MNFLEKIVGYIEIHAVEGIRECFENGVSPNDYFNNEPLIYELTSEYTRSPAFKNCVNAFVDYGLKFEDNILLAVLLDDAKLLTSELNNHPNGLHNTYTLRCAYTPLYKVSLLHICAEFNHINCAKLLVQHGADINATAGIDDYGFGGQTPLFHTVNQNSNHSIDMFNFLLSKSADVKFNVTGFIWGKSYPWETFIPAVNPISYAMMGLLPQMHRHEKTISAIVSKLIKVGYGIDYVPSNIPNRYLRNV